MGRIQVFTGNGHGKSPAAIGEAMMRAAKGDQVVIIQYLKGKGLEDSELIKRLEPEMKIFHFEKSDDLYEKLSDAEKHDEIVNIKNGINFARKVISTGGCELLVLDEILGLVDYGILSVEDLKDMLSLKPDGMDIIMTGIKINEEIREMSDDISVIM